MALWKLHGQQIADTWQARCLRESRGKTAAVIMAVMFQNYRDDMPYLLRQVWPGFRDIRRPFISGGAVIAPNGKVLCGVVHEGCDNPIAQVIYYSEGDLVKDMRDLADRLKLNDRDRVEMTEAFKKWVVADRRVDHLGRKMAS